MSGFASQNDLLDKIISFEELGEGLYGYTAEGDPNSGVIIGDDSVMVIDAQATPLMAQDVIKRIRQKTDKPIKHLVLSHYHAVRVLGAPAYNAEIIASRACYEMILERGAQDMDSEIGRFPRLFRGRESVTGLTYPHVVFDKKLTMFMGKREVEIIHIGRSHTAGDTIVWLPKERVLFAGDTIEFGATPYCGDAHFKDWGATLDAIKALKPLKIVPGRGRSLMNEAECLEAIEGTRNFTHDLYQVALKGVAKGHGLKQVYDAAMEALRPKYGSWVIFEHCMPFNVTRAYDEAGGLDHPRIWTDKRDIEMWQTLEKGMPVKSAEVHG
jgi:glyoxylase-like metal-dependent hydrolase (beta-lactamase superfamily II)